MMDWTPPALVTVGLLVLVQDRLRARDARRARTESYLTAVDQGGKLDAIQATADVTHNIVNNDHTRLVRELVDAKDALGRHVSGAQRAEAATPITPDPKGTP